MDLLTTYDQAELERRDEAIRQAELKEQEEARRAAIRKTADSFVLTGSTRPADLAGQCHLF